MNEKILDILESICGSPVVKEDMDINLFEEGLLDSLGVIEFLVELEDKLNITIDPIDIERDKINTPKNLLDFINSTR